MGVTAVLVITAAIFAWGAVSARLERADLTAPVVFVAIGGLLAWTGVLGAPVAAETLKPIVELTLVWVLFSDAAGVPLHEMRADLSRYLRLLAVGLPLTILFGWALASWIFPGLGVWLALLVGAALAPTDAALGLPVVTNRLVPARVRRIITVESGLNDGIATPVVMFAIAGAAAAEGLEGAPGSGAALVELALGLLVGGVVGGAGGFLLRWTRRHRWAAEDFAGIAVLALAVLAYAAALAVSGNGFVAAFCGGLAFGATAGRRGAAELVFLEQAGSLVSLLVWMTFGLIALPVVVDRISLPVVCYAVLSLTLVRMVPVALASLGSGLDRSSVLFIGWFGPRGLASLVFALLALEALGPAADEAVTVIAVTVVLSVLAHGISAGPLAARYGRAHAATTPSGHEREVDTDEQHGGGSGRHAAYGGPAGEAVRLLLAPDAFLQGRVAGWLELRKLAVGPEREHISLVRRLPVRRDPGQHDDMIALGDEVLWLGLEGLARECPEVAGHLLLAAVPAADGAVPGHDPFDVVGHVAHGPLHVACTEGLIGRLGRCLVLRSGHATLLKRLIVSSSAAQTLSVKGRSGSRGLRPDKSREPGAPTRRAVMGCRPFTGVSGG